LRRPDAAEEELQAALKLKPGYAPALLNLANLKEERGDRDGALSLYERILSLDPADSHALARYASLKSAAEIDDGLIGRLKQAIANPRSNKISKATLGFALGKVLDEKSAYEDAFEAFAAANRHSRESVDTRTSLYDRNRHEQFVSELIAAFPQGKPKTAVSTPSDSPIFICGMFRSGSTLVEQILASHPHVTAGGEIDFLARLVNSPDLAPFPSAIAGVPSEKFSDLAELYRSNLSKLFPGADRVTDKRPDNFLYIGVIKSLFPNARIVHTTRDPLDNCLSTYFVHLDHSMGYALDLMDTGHYYRQYRRLMAHWKSLYGADILDFDYDALTRDPKPAVEALLAYCGLEWNEACLSFHQARNVVKTASAWQVRQPLYRSSSGRWRNYERQLAPLREYLMDLK
jgi:tetratricopeptide (TPR) repeat protein